jgi:hypothetical protein
MPGLENSSRIEAIRPQVERMLPSLKDMDDQQLYAMVGQIPLSAVLYAPEASVTEGLLATAGHAFFHENDRFHNAVCSNKSAIANAIGQDVTPKT